MVWLNLLLAGGLALTAVLAWIGLDQLFRAELDPLEQAAVGSALSLGFTGLATLFLGLLGALRHPLLALILPGVLFARLLVRRWPKTGLSWSGAFPAVLVAVLVCVALVGALAPLDVTDWDSLAYHLAVPKLWLAWGRIAFVPAIHHSNFPFTAELLYVPMLAVAGESGAKLMNVLWLLTGCCALWGMARRWYGPGAGGWAAVGFAGCPVVLWEAGTGYVDIPHGLFAGLATLYLADALSGKDRRYWALVGLCLGFALGTKHTGLQTLAAIVLVALSSWALSRVRKSQPQETEAEPKPPANVVRGLATSLFLALAIASPWYVKSWAMTGNPLYPFLYRQLDGKDWDEWRADIYTQEQKSFGVRPTPGNLGHAVLGLAYQPGRYVNPGQQEGAGFPTGAVGFSGLLAGALWCLSGKAGPRERAVLAVVGASLLAWFVLTQQSRYLVSLVVPLCVLAGGASARLQPRWAAPAAVAIQATYSLGLLWVTQTSAQLPVVLHQVSRDEYSAARNPFFIPSRAINENQSVRRVALYDEVFGFLLDKPYLWANPGHSTLIPYLKISDGRGLARELANQGFSHAYVNLQLVDRAFRNRWLAAMGPLPYDAAETEAMRQDPNLWWRWLFADAVRSGSIRAVQEFPPDRARSVLFEIAR